MAPQSQLFGETLVVGRDPRQLFLTYDDGPNDPHTLKLLDLLAKHDAKATFFLIGRYVRQRPDIARRMVASGHAIGNHTYTHPNLIFLSSGGLARELDGCNKAIEDAVGQRPTLFRPPFGGRRPDTLSTARKLGLLPVMWSVTSFDWKPTRPEVIAAYTERALRKRKQGGHIVLLHDGSHATFGADRSATVGATEMLLEKFRGSHEFVSVDS